MKYDFKNNVFCLCIYRYSKNLDTIYVVSGAVNTMDPKAIINTISHAVYYPELEPVTGASDLVLVKASILIKKKDYFININIEILF